MLSNPQRCHVPGVFEVVSSFDTSLFVCSVEQYVKQPRICWCDWIVYSVLCCFSCTLVNFL